VPDVDSLWQPIQKINREIPYTPTTTLSSPNMASKTPVNGVGYDQALLADAPEITRADKQVRTMLAGIYL